jgi:hypothetical protein
LLRLPVSSSPTFPGRVIVPEASIWYDGDRPVHIRIFGGRFVVGQDVRTLRVAITEDGGFEWRYNLDGTESYHVLPLPNGDTHSTSKVVFDGSKIRITTERFYDPKQATVRTIEVIADDMVRVEAPFGRNREMIGSVYRRVRVD